LLFQTAKAKPTDKLEPLPGTDDTHMAKTALSSLPAWHFRGPGNYWLVLQGPRQDQRAILSARFFEEKVHRESPSLLLSLLVAHICNHRAFQSQEFDL
jgi:hypothetical protein